MKAVIAAMASLPSLALACSLDIGFYEQRPFNFDVYHGDFYATSGGANVDIMRAIEGRSGCEMNLSNISDQEPFSSGTQAFLAPAGTLEQRSVVLYELPYEFLSAAPLPSDLSELTIGLLNVDVPQEWKEQFAATDRAPTLGWQQELTDGKFDAVLWHPMDNNIRFYTDWQRQAVSDLPMRAMNLYYSKDVPQSVRKTIADTLVQSDSSIDYALTRHQLKR